MCSPWIFITIFICPFSGLSWRFCCFVYACLVQVERLIWANPSHSRLSAHTLHGICNGNFINIATLFNVKHSNTSFNNRMWPWPAFTSLAKKNNKDFYIIVLCSLCSSSARLWALFSTAEGRRGQTREVKKARKKAARHRSNAWQGLAITHRPIVPRVLPFIVKFNNSYGCDT